MQYLPSWRSIPWRTELLAGVTVAMTMIPESLSFALLAGLTPLMGLYAAFIMGLVTAVLGGRPGLVSGGAGATVVVLIALVVEHGTNYVLAAIVLAGVLQILVGVCKLGKFVRMIPQPVMYGFLNGLAIIIFGSQISQFQTTTNGTTAWMTGTSLYLMLGLTALTIAVVVLFPKITRKIPASLVAIIVVFAVVSFFQIDTKKVVDIAEVSGGWPVWQFPKVPFTWETLTIIFPYAVIMAAVGLVESLLTLNLVDEITESKGSANQEAIAQGTANALNGFLGGMGGCAMVAQTMVNLEAGARTRVAAVIAALTILLVILVAGPIIGQIPMAALVGVMVMVSLGTFQWGFFRLFTKMPKSDIFIGLTVALITVVMHNLALAVLIGVILSALVFAWDNAQRIRARKSLLEDGTKVYEIYGPLFFGSTMAFSEKFDPHTDPQQIIIDFAESRLVDMSAIETLKKVIERYAQVGKIVRLRHLSPDSVRLLKNTKGYIEINQAEDPTYMVTP